jgi:hypothetical protein
MHRFFTKPETLLRLRRGPLGDDLDRYADWLSEQGEQNDARGKRRDHAYRLEAHERDTIFGYYANPSRGLPPGLAKRGGNLPPGLEKQLARNGTLPPGLEKRLEPLPVELERELPPLPAGCGCRRGVVGTNVVLIRTRDHFLLDVVHISGR